MEFNPHIDLSQKVGTFIAVIVAIFTGEYTQIMVNTLIGATLGFVVTTALKYLWAYIRKKCKIKNDDEIK